MEIRTCTLIKAENGFLKLSFMNKLMESKLQPHPSSNEESHDFYQQRLQTQLRRQPISDRDKVATSLYLTE